MIRTSVAAVLWRPLQWIRHISPQAAAATLGLIFIQVGIGIVMKAAQTSGSYSFSPSASVTISEFLKLCLSSLFFFRQWRQRTIEEVKFVDEAGKSHHGPQASHGGEEEEMTGLEKREHSSLESAREHLIASPQLNPVTFWHDLRAQITRQKTTGFYILALCYTLMNNSVFVSYKLADPGTIQLTKSGGTVITALVMVVSLNTRISRIQWIAIVIQMLGLILTQYKPDSGTTYPLSTYAILLLQVLLSALSGVYNQYLLKRDDSSLHVDNMVLYGAGTFINLLCHLLIRTISADEASFFEGYNSIGAVMVVLSNVFIGLAITAVYKYANAVIKCFATALSTGILLYISPILFGTELGDLVLIGAGIVFVASGLYMAYPPIEQYDQPAASKSSLQSLLYSQLVTMFSVRISFAAGDFQFFVLCIRLATFTRVALLHLTNNTQKFQKTLLGILTLLSLIFVAFLTIEKAAMPDLLSNGEKAAPDSAPINDVIASPFNNSLAMIRWNSPHPERIPLLKKYEPFFHTVHISMPEMMSDRPPEFHNLISDQFPGTYAIYTQVAKVMKLILSEQSQLDGLMYFHFDAWIDPMAWNNTDRRNIWFPVAEASREGPRFVCMNDTATYDWWGWKESMHLGALTATNVIDRLDFGYKVNRDEWCLGWSDIYYIPRRFFPDFILLADIFSEFGVFHEVAIPTIVRIIEESRSPSLNQSAVERIKDCWGSCCSSNPTTEDVLTSRCGHRLDYLAENVTGRFYEKLDGQAKLLGRKLGDIVSSTDSDNEELGI